MKSTEFCYWLQGFFEINSVSGIPNKVLNGAQVEMIEKHLALVFRHEIDPSYPKEQQADLDKIHNGAPGNLSGTATPTSLMRC